MASGKRENRLRTASETQADLWQSWRFVASKACMSFNLEMAGVDGEGYGSGVAIVQYSLEFSKAWSRPQATKRAHGCGMDMRTQQCSIHKTKRLRHGGCRSW